MITSDEEQRFTAAMMAHAQQTVCLELDVITSCVVIGALQLALRHPDFPATSRGIVTDLLATWRTRLATLDPMLGEGIGWGNDPSNDKGCSAC